MATHGAKVEWLTADGSMAISIDGFATREEAIREVYALALRWGYRPPRWWEFRRRSVETDYPRQWADALARP